MAWDMKQKFDSTLGVQQGQPVSSDGGEGDERWCWIETKGLFHAKKYRGEWRFRFYSTSPLTLEEEILEGASVHKPGGKKVSVISEVVKVIN